MVCTVPASRGKLQRWLVYDLLPRMAHILAERRCSTIKPATPQTSTAVTLDRALASGERRHGTVNAPRRNNIYSLAVWPAVSSPAPTASTSSFCSPDRARFRSRLASGKQGDHPHPPIVSSLRTYTRCLLKMAHEHTSDTHQLRRPPNSLVREFAARAVSSLCLDAGQPWAIAGMAMTTTIRGDERVCGGQGDERLATTQR